MAASKAAPRKPRCPVCGHLTARAGYLPGEHTTTCTPALRGLVRAAEDLGTRYDKNDFSDAWDRALIALTRAVARFRKEQEARRG